VAVGAPNKLSALMRAPRFAIAALLAAALGGGVAACGSEEELHVIEGEPLEVGEVSYNVQITRFLNPDDPEDQGYLAGQERPEPGEAYLGVFLTIENEGDEEFPVPSEFVVTDTEGTEHEPIPSRSAYALQLPGLEPDVESLTQSDEDLDVVEDLQPLDVPAHGEIPIPDTTAAEGVIGGAMLLFVVEQEVTENRPLELEVPAGDGETGVIELDI
jgi:hypothetical protein